MKSAKILKSAKPKKFILVGYDYQEKVVAPHSASASKIYLPVEYVGHKVAVILLEPIEDAGSKG